MGKWDGTRRMLEKRIYSLDDKIRKREIRTASTILAGDA